MEAGMEEMKAELTDLEQAIQTEELKMKSLIENRTTTISHLEADKASVIEDIRCASQKAVKFIKSYEEGLILKVEQMTDQGIKELESDIEQGNIQIQTCREHQEMVKQAVGSDSEAEVREKLEQWKSRQLVTRQDRYMRIVGGRISALQFSKEKETVTDVRLGEVVRLQPVCDPKTSSVLIDTLITRVKEDTKIPFIVDIAILYVGGIQTVVVTDSNNQCVKSFYTRNYRRCDSRLLLENTPWGIARLGENKVMVALPDGKQIVTVAVAPDHDLEQVSSLDVQQAYYNLAVMSSSSFAAGRAGCVDILNMQGEVMQTYTDVKLFSSPRYMCKGYMGDLLVSNCNTGSVTSITADGDTMCLYSVDDEKVDSCKGITTTIFGDILFADSNKNLIQLSESGWRVRDVPIDTGSQTPAGICLDRDGLLHVCAGASVLQFQFIRK